MARHSKVAELVKRFIVGKRITRARINLGIMLITKPDGTFRFIWNGKPLAQRFAVPNKSEGAVWFCYQHYPQIDTGSGVSDFMVSDVIVEGSVMGLVTS